MNYGNTAADVRSVGGAATPSRLSEVQEQMHRSARSMKGIEEKFKVLYERLQPVLRNTASENRKDPSTPKPTLVGHAEALSNHNDQLELLESSLAEILDRLEL